MKLCKDCVFFNLPDNSCRHSAPTASLTGSPAVVWPKVNPESDWCAEGYNNVDGFYTQSPAVGHG